MQIGKPVIKTMSWGILKSLFIKYKHTASNKDSSFNLNLKKNPKKSPTPNKTQLKILSLGDNCKTPASSGPINIFKRKHYFIFKLYKVLAMIYMDKPPVQQLTKEEKLAAIDKQIARQKKKIAYMKKVLEESLQK